MNLVLQPILIILLLHLHPYTIQEGIDAFLERRVAQPEFNLAGSYKLLEMGVC